MSAGTVSSTSTYQPGKGMSFAKDIGSRVLDAAVAAKDEKKLQEKIEADGGTVPESAKKGLFAKALKTQFITNPVNDLKKSFNKKLSGAANIVGLFGKKGRALEDKMRGKKIGMSKGGFDRSGYQKAGQDDDDDGGGSSGGGGGSGVASLGALVLDIQAIASTVSSMQGLINTQMSISSQISTSLDDIKNVLSEQVSLQQQRISGEEMAAREASLESSVTSAGSADSTSTFKEGGMLGDLLKMFGDLKNLLGVLKSLPEMFGGFFKKLVSKLPGGEWLLKKLGGKALGAAAGGAAEAGVAGGIRALIMAPLRGALKAIPFGIGGLIDFFISLALGESPGRAAARAVGASIGSWLGGLAAGLLGLPSGPGAMVTAGLGMAAGAGLGDLLGGGIYDLFAGGKKDEKMAAGGAMIGEAGKEAVVNLDSAQGRGALGGGDNSAGGDTYFKAIAGTTLAVTKSFVEGLGPIGSSIAPVIQDDISKLGKNFELPATAIKMSVGGMGLKRNPQAANQGKKYLQELVKGTLDKLLGKKEEKKSTGSGSTGTPASSIDQSSPSAAAAGAQGAGSVDQQRAGATDAMKAGQSSQTGSSFSSKLEDRNGGEVKFKGNNGEAYKVIINATNGDYEVFEDKFLGLQIDIKGNKNQAIKQSALNQVRAYFVNNAPQKGIELKYITADDVKNKTEITKKADGEKIGAASGISITSNGKGNKQLTPGKTFGYSDLNPHHSDEGRVRSYGGPIGVPKDYGMSKLPNFMPSGPMGQVPIPVSGKVLMKEWNKESGYGRTVVVETSLGKMQFSHLSKFGSFNVGDQLSAGTIVGVQGGSGNRGESDYAPHLHLNASKKGHEAFVNFITSGKPTTGATDDIDKQTSEDGNTGNTGEPKTATEMIADIEKGLKGIMSGFAVMSGAASGDIKTKEQADKVKSDWDSVLQGRSPTPAAGAAPKTVAVVPPGGGAASTVVPIPIQSGVGAVPQSLYRTPIPGSTLGALAPA